MKSSPKLNGALYPNQNRTLHNAVRFLNLLIMAMAISDRANATDRSNVSTLLDKHRLTTTAIITPIYHNIQNRLSVIRFIYMIECLLREFIKTPFYILIKDYKNVIIFWNYKGIITYNYWVRYVVWQVIFSTIRTTS